MPEKIPTTEPRHGARFLSTPIPVYYDVLEPPGSARPATVVMVHGGAHSASCYLTTADGRPGWAHVFARHGYRTVVPDWPGCGRSGYVAPESLDGETVWRGLGGLLSQLEPPLVLLAHSMGGAFAWRLLERHADAIATLVAVAPAPPGNIQPEPEILRESETEIEIGTLHRAATVEKGAPYRPTRDFIERKLVGESRFFRREWLEAYAASLLPVPERLLFQRMNIRGSQVRVEDPGRLAGKRVLVVTGTADLDHPRETDAAIVTWLDGCGARAEFLWLGDRGIDGNGHMLMLEENSDDIAALILDWMARAVPM
jgi:pimeloyl-ACP methyl ester carboxylesterase